MKSEFIYHILIDRFTGDPAKYPSRGFTGGTLRGVLEQLDYIQSLGVTGIMISPFNKTAAYHGYHITDYTQVDPHFGTWEDVDDLVGEVHRRGMVIVADFVANHSHEDNPLFKDGEHAEWFLRKKDGQIRGFAGLGFLPMFNTDHPEVREYLTARGLELCKRGFDAIRLDHATGPSYGFWKYFRTSLKAQYPQVKLIGEVWGELDFRPKSRLRFLWHKLRYPTQEAIQMEYIRVLDGVLDFQYQSLLQRFVHKAKAERRWDKLHQEAECHFARYPTDFSLWLFLDNHDMNRFLFECGGDKSLLRKAIDFTRQWEKPYLMYYGTEK